MTSAPNPDSGGTDSPPSGRVPTETIELPRDFSVPRFGSIFGGLALLLFGLLLLMHTKFEMSLVWVKDWWPVAPILFGAYLLVRGIQDLSNREGSEH